MRPRFALFENVRNLLSHEKGQTFQEVLFQIAKAGYDAEWSVISARDMGACHLRERIWIVAYTNDYGSSSTKRIRVDGKTDSGTQERQNQTSQSAGSSESRNSKVVQRPTELTDTDSKRLERRLPEHQQEHQQELQETGQPGQKDSLRSTNTDSSGTQSDSEGMEKPIWK